MSLSHVPGTWVAPLVLHVTLVMFVVPLRLAFEPMREMGRM